METGKCDNLISFNISNRNNPMYSNTASRIRIRENGSCYEKICSTWYMQHYVNKIIFAHLQASYLMWKPSPL
jgi:hypothetical protein